jgi:hypothetical protein
MKKELFLKNERRFRRLLRISTDFFRCEKAQNAQKRTKRAKKRFIRA